MIKLLHDIFPLLVQEATPVRDMLARMDRAALGVVLVADERGRLLATITDGDVRRALLQNLDLDESVGAMLARRAHAAPAALAGSASETEIARALRQRQVRHLPLLDDDGAVVALAMPVIDEGSSEARALIMAGGFGQRLGELTASTPKPMLPVRGRPMISWVIDRIAQAGIQEVYVSIHYLGDQIREFLADGAERNLSIRYLEEPEPRGTAGAVGMAPPSTKPLLVVNADVMCSLDLAAIVAFHQEEKAELTMAVRRHEVDVPFGVVECSALSVRRLTEKPRLPFLINAGVYVLSPSACAAVPRDGRFDMTDLAQLLLNADRSVKAYPIDGDWLDVGRPEDYERAQQAPPPVASA
jgi:dTDP-glucose pyrophosphorylase